MDFAFVTEGDYTVFNRKEGMVSTHRNILAGKYIRAALTY